MGLWRERFWKLAANVLSASRFFLAALWIAVFAGGNRPHSLLGPIALAAAASDFADGRLARRIGSAGEFGRWLDAIADIAFILTALSCEAHAGSIPIYIPVLIAVSFGQYAIDSVIIFGSAIPVASRLGHWGGVVNFALVIALGFGPPPGLPGHLVGQAAPWIAIFYLAAITERAFNYRRLRAASRSA